MVVTFQESVKKIVEWLNTGESGYFHHPYTNVKEIEPGQFLVIDDMEPPELDKSKIVITEDIAVNLVAKLFGMSNKNTAVIQSIISSSVRRNTGIFIPTEYFNKMLFCSRPNDQSSKVILSKATAHTSENRDVKLVINNSKRILPSPNPKTVQSVLKNQNRLATPSSIETKNSQSSRSVHKSINKNNISNVTFVMSNSGKLVPLAITTPETNQRTPYRNIVNIQKQNGPIKTIWNPLNPSPTNNDVMSQDQRLSDAKPNQMFTFSNTNQTGGKEVYQHVTRSPLDDNVFNIPHETSSYNTNQMYILDGQSRMEYTPYNEANCGYELRKDQDRVHLPKNTMSYNNLV